MIIDIAELKEAMNIVLIVAALIGIVDCFFGYTFRKVLPFFIGLAFGFILGSIVNAALQKADGNLFENISNLLNRFFKYIDGSGENIGKELYNENTLRAFVVPAISAILLACLSAKFYRFTMGLCCAVSAFFIVYLCLVGNEYQLLISAASAIAGFALMFFLYDYLFILSTAVSGAWTLSRVSLLVGIISIDHISIVFIVLSVLGAICQIIQLHGKKHSARSSKDRRHGNITETTTTTTIVVRPTSSQKHKQMKNHKNRHEYIGQSDESIDDMDDGEDDDDDDDDLTPLD